MKLSRIDHIALNGGDGAHYKYVEVADKILGWYYEGHSSYYEEAKAELIKLLMEAFPNDEA